MNESTFLYMSKVLKSCKDKLGISGPIPFECAEDETKCIELATWNRRLDTIDGSVVSRYSLITKAISACLT